MISQDRARKIKLILMKISGNGNSRYSLQMSLLTANKVWGFCDACFLLDLVKAGDAGWDSLQMIYRASSRAKR